MGYLAALALSAPVLAVRPKLREKLRDALATRDGAIPTRSGHAPCVMIHAVSVGEINATRALVAGLRERVGGVHLLITTTTKTGLARADELFGRDADVTVARFPLDYSQAVHRLLDAARPDVIVLMELEVWPGMMCAAKSRKIPVIIGNGRITANSARAYAWLGPIGRSMFSRVDQCLAQDTTHAARFKALGVPSDRICIAGTMKFDSAPLIQSRDDIRQLGQSLRESLALTQPLIVAGSTGPGEEAMLLDLYATLRHRIRGLRLMLVPRKPERFDEVAILITQRGFACVRRSERRAAREDEVILLDTMGELRQAYACAEAVVVGRTLVDLGAKQHGSDMIEPAALGLPTVVGPFTGNFEEPMRALIGGHGIRTVDHAQQLLDLMLEWFDPDGNLRPEAVALGERGRQVVAQHRGATRRHLEAIVPKLYREDVSC